MKLRTFLAAFVLLSASLFARADEFSYTFTAVEPAGFTLISPTLITSATILPATTCSLGGTICDEVEIDPTGSAEVIPSFPEPGFAFFDDSVRIGALAGEYPSSFFTVGSHSFEGSTMVITDIPASVTPEPSSLILLGTGMLGIVGTIRRRTAPGCV